MTTPRFAMPCRTGPEPHHVTVKDGAANLFGGPPGPVVAARHVDVLVPGHGAVAEGPDVAARLAADHAYIDALRRGEEPVDARLAQDWLSGPHQSNLEQARHSSG
jgi:hypothetical protein